MMDFNLEQVKALAELANEQQLAEITITDGDKKLTIKTPASVAPVMSAAMPALPMVAPAAQPAPVGASAVATTATPAAAPVAEEANLHIVTSPMVGAFYRSPSPEASAFVEVGSTVGLGQALCILEAMKQMNTLESDIAGTIVEILGQNGQPVEFGQPLFKVRLA
ncbi:MAG: acetyl-CoA carboxylase biotin carboxyl carrier protein [Vampirovibrionales bacterium]